jgi:hypothetical protein
LALENFGPGFFQIFWFEAVDSYASKDGNSLITSGGTFTATEQPGALVPEPASLGIVAAGSVCVAAFINRRRHRTSGLMLRRQPSLT